MFTSGITAAIGDSAGHHGGYNLHLAILQRGPGVEVHQNAAALLSSRGPQPAACGQAENRNRREPPRHAVPAAKLRRRGGVARLLWERSQSSLNQWSQHALVQCCLSTSAERQMKSLCRHASEHIVGHVEKSSGVYYADAISVFVGTISAHIDTVSALAGA